VIVRTIVQALDLQIVAGHAALERPITGGYCADLLSCVMARAKANNVWITLQAHPNVLAVAVLLELAAVIVTEGIQPDATTCQKAQAEEVIVLSSPHTTYAVVARLAALGVAASE